MQDRFVGDVGDFGKYGLLRALTGVHPEAKPRLSLGVVWYVPDRETVASTKASHGLRLDYLQQPAMFRPCDPDLFDCLQKTVEEEARSIGAIQQLNVLGDEDAREVTFFSKPLPRGWPKRQEWLEEALTQMAAQDIVLLDPDIGLAPRGKANTDSPTHVYPREIRPFLANGQTVVVYQHHAYKPPQVEGQRRNWGRALRTLEFRYPRRLSFEQRDFIILPSATHAAAIDARLSTLLSGPWRRHFALFEPS